MECCTSKAKVGLLGGVTLRKVEKPLPSNLIGKLELVFRWMPAFCLLLDFRAMYPSIMLNTFLVHAGCEVDSIGYLQVYLAVY